MGESRIWIVSLPNNNGCLFSGRGKGGYRVTSRKQLLATDRKSQENRKFESMHKAKHQVRWS